MAVCLTRENVFSATKLGVLPPKMIGRHVINLTSFLGVEIGLGFFACFLYVNVTCFYLLILLNLQ